MTSADVSSGSESSLASLEEFEVGPGARVRQRWVRLQTAQITRRGPGYGGSRHVAQRDRSYAAVYVC